MVRDDDVIPGEVAAAPRAPPLPLARAAVRRPERAQQRHDQVLRQRVPTSRSAAPAAARNPRRRSSDGAAAAAGGRPGERGDGWAAVAGAVPGVAVEGAGGGVERRRQGLRCGDSSGRRWRRRGRRRRGAAEADAAAAAAGEGERGRGGRG